MDRVGKNPETTTRGEDTCREMKVKSEESKPHVSFVYLVVFKSPKNTKVHIDSESEITFVVFVG